MRSSRLLIAPIAFATIAMAAACGGGHGGYTPPKPSASPSASPSPASQQQTLTMSPSGPVTATFSGIASGAAGSVTLPATTSGTAAATLTLQSSEPSGDPTPAARRIHSGLRHQILGAAVTPIAYITLSLAGGVTINQTPALTFTFPAGTLSGYAYIALYDPSNPTQGWTAIQGPVTASGTSIAFSAASISPAVALSANVNYVFAIVETGTPLPSPSPSATSSPTSAPSAAATPADCPASFTSASGGVPLNITDDSGLSGAQLLVYVENGTEFLSADGSFDSVNPDPLPAACFKTTTGSAGTKSLLIPSPSGGRIYFAYGQYTAGSTTIPNPLAGGNISGPPGAGGGLLASFPWDVVEYTAPTGVVDTTQVEALGLPLELSVGATPLPVTTAGTTPTPPPAGVTPAPCADTSPSSGPGAVVGVTSCNFANIFFAMEQIPQYDQNVVAASFSGATLDTRIISPNGAQGLTPFDWNLFADTTPASAVCPSSHPYGYLSCVLYAYAQPGQGRLFTTNVNGVPAPPASPAPHGVTGDNYCATSDGSSNFEFTDVGPTGTCTSTPNPNVSPNPFKLSVYSFMYGKPPAEDTSKPGGVQTQVCEPNLLFAQPFNLTNVDNYTGEPAGESTSGHLFGNFDAFALWKGLNADLNYGTALQYGPGVTHPVIPAGPTAIFSTLFQNDLYNQYDYLMHEYFGGELAYGVAYDDLFKLSTSLSLQSGGSIDVRINAIPSSSTAYMPGAAFVQPTPCPVFTPGIGTY